MTKQTVRIGGRDFPVIGTDPKYGIPIVDIPMMSDEEWKRRAESPENLRRLREHGWEQDAKTGEWRQERRVSTKKAEENI